MRAEDRNRYGSMVEADALACAAAIRVGSRSFHVAGLLLPATVHRSALALYAFCRLADDAIDHAPTPAAAAEALDALERRLLLAYQGTPHPEPADRAFARAVRQHDIPIDVPRALLEGFCWDSRARRYATIDELIDYAMRVAGTVGVMMALIMGVRSASALARACDLGVAMQLSNIARDVGEDARAGRLYLPVAWLQEEGIDVDEFLVTPQASAPLARVVARLLAAAEPIYARAAGGIALLPASCRPAIHVALHLYRDIGRQVARNGLDSVSTRAVVSAPRKLALAACGAVAGFSIPSADVLDSAPLPQVRPLLASVSPPLLLSLEGLRWWNLRRRVIRVIDLFQRLERRAAP